MLFVGKSESLKEGRLTEDISMDTLSIKKDTTNPILNISRYGKKHSEEKFTKINPMKRLENTLCLQDS